jgi:hypothetical protein
MERLGMKKPSKRWIGLLAVVGFAGAANAQMGVHMGPPNFHGVWNPVIGKGAVYEMQTQDRGKTSMEISVVGKESVEGKDGYWVQTTIDNAEMGGQMVMKSLAVMTQDEVVFSKLIMQMPGRPPMEMSQMMQRGRANSHADIRGDAQDVGSETITVPAGTFMCEHYKTKDGGDVWVAKDVPPWGMVKYQGKDTTMMLTKVVTDAKDKIIGTPQPFNPMNMMQQPPQ